MKGCGKRLMAALVLVGVLLGVTGCGDKAAGKQENATVYVPEFHKIDLGELGIEYINNGCCDDTNAYVLAEVMEEVEQTDPFSGETYTNYEYRTSIFRFPMDGGEAAELENYVSSSEMEKKPDRETYFYVESLRSGGDGTIWVAETLEEYIYDVPEDFDPEMDQLWNYEMLEQRSTRIQRQLDATGTELKRLDTSGLEEVLGVGERGGYIGNSLMDKDGNLYVFVEIYGENTYTTKIVVLDPEMNILFEVAGENLWGQMILLGDGSVAVNRYIHNPLTGEGGQMLCVIDREKQDWSETQYPMPMNAGSVYAGSDRYLFYYDNGDSLYGYDPELEEGVKLLTWSSADINRGNVSFFTFLPDGRVAAMTNRWGEQGMEVELVTLTEQPASVWNDRTTLTYATMYLGYDTREKIIEFNKSQSDYRIVIRDYSEFNTADDYNAGLTKLNTEIIAGQVPDILDASGLPINRYGANGLLEDLWPFIENDEEIGGREGVMEEVFEAAQQEGKLYQVFNGFTIRTAAGAAKVVGEGMSWTLDDLMAALEAMPEGCSVFSEGDTKESMLNNVMAMQMDNFVDWSTGECWFDSEGFVSLLEFCNTFPLKYDWSQVDYDFYEDENTRLVNGRQLLSVEYLYDFQALQIKKAMFGGDVSYIGYPREDGGVGSSFAFESGVAMATTCKDKEGAWAFIRQTLLPQSGEEEEYFYFRGWGFPVNRHDFERMAEQYMTPQYILDENGEPVLDENGEPIEQSQGGIGWGNGEMVELYATTQEEYDQIMALYHAIDTVYNYDESIYSIVLEVAQRYFNEDISAQAAADQIQSRVKIYVNENL